MNKTFVEFDNSPTYAADVRCEIRENNFTPTGKHTCGNVIELGIGEIASFSLAVDLYASTPTYLLVVAGDGWSEVHDTYEVYLDSALDSIPGIIASL